MVGSGSSLWSNPKLSLFYETLIYLNTTIKIFLNIFFSRLKIPVGVWGKGEVVWDIVAGLFFFFQVKAGRLQFSSVQPLSHVWLFATSWIAARLPVHHQLLEFTQTHVYWVGCAIQPSHPLSSPSPPALYLSQHQGLFKWVSSLHQVAKVLEFQPQHQSVQWIFRTDFL